jgi:hypothetical protein
MGIFTRRRPPVYVFDNVWEPHFIDADVDNHATAFTWKHPDDFHSQLIALSWDTLQDGIRHTYQEWWNFRDGDRIIFNFGFRTTNQLGLHTNSLSVIGYATYSQYNDTKSFGALPDHFYMTPGQTITYNFTDFIAGDELLAVRLYLRRWMLR